MQDEITLTDDNVVDSHFYVQGEQHTVMEYLEGIDSILNEIKQSGDFISGANTLRSMSAIGHAIGISKAKLLHGMWILWEGEEENFYQYVFQYANLSNRLIIDRYILAWKGILHVPVELIDYFITKPMKDLNALGAAISQGFLPEGAEWDRLAVAGSNQEFLQIIREDLKGKPARKNSITIYVEPSGDLVAWIQGIPHNIGYLNILQMDDSTEKAITRIVKSSGLIQRF